MANLTKDEWARTKGQFPVGKVVRGQVAIAWDFMVFVSLSDTEVLGVVVITSLSDKPPPAADFPGVGDTVTAIVVGHRDDGQQIDLSLRPSDFKRLSP